MIILFFLFFADIFYIHAIDFKKIEKHVDNTPASKTKNTKDLSEYLTREFVNDDEKYAAIYFWVAKNIDYDVRSRYATPVYHNIREIIDEVMRRKKGVCQHYSELFNELCRLSGLKSFVVNGYGKEYGKVMNLAHAWNVIIIEGEYYFVDATWGAGHINAEGKYERDFSLEYFMVKPEKFIDDHISFDPMWQLLKRPLYFQEFETGIDNRIVRPEFHFKDSIDNYLRQSPIEQLRSSIRRIENNGIANKLVKFELDYLRNNLKILEFNEAVGWFNQGNTYYNKAVSMLNEFYELKRKKIRESSISLAALKKKMSEIEKNLAQAELNYNKVQTENTELKQNLKKAFTNIKKFKSIIAQQQEWLSGLTD